MEQSDVSFEAYRKWKAKEQEYEDFEREHKKQKKELEDACDAAQNLHGDLVQRVNEEKDSMFHFIQNLELEQEEGQPFFQKLDGLVNDSEIYLRRQVEKLDLKGDKLDQSYKKQVEQFEIDIDRLRREYGETLD